MAAPAPSRERAGPAIGLACFSILGGEGRHHTTSRAAAGAAAGAEHPSGCFADRSLGSVQVGRVLCSYISCLQPFTFITPDYKIAPIVELAHSSQPLLSHQFSFRIAHSRGMRAACVRGGRAGTNPAVWVQNNISRLGKSDLPLVLVPARTRQVLPPAGPVESRRRSWRSSLAQDAGSLLGAEQRGGTRAANEEPMTG